MHESKSFERGRLIWTYMRSYIDFSLEAAAWKQRSPLQNNTIFSQYIKHQCIDKMEANIHQYTAIIVVFIYIIYNAI